MKIKSLRIQNFRCFRDETISLEDYTCFVGPNGAGKSTVLAALNVFFRQNRDSSTDLHELSLADFHHGNHASPIEITVTFSDLSESATNDLSDYVRQGLLIVSAIAVYDPGTQRAAVKQFGSRMAIPEFAKFFAASKEGEPLARLRDIYKSIGQSQQELPSITTKVGMVDALRKFELDHPEQCEPIRSADQFYGATKGANLMGRHVNWIFIPASKDITTESRESKDTGLNQLLKHSVRSKVDFDREISTLRETTLARYSEILRDEQDALKETSTELEKRLQTWAHPKASAQLNWGVDEGKSVKVEAPFAQVKLSERGFDGDLARFGHGMQRSYMLALIEMISESNRDEEPTLLLGIEEPELYQHPPQARHLASVLQEMSHSGSQIMLCSHSPYFIPGDNVETIRIVRDVDQPSTSMVRGTNYSDLSKALGSATHAPLKERGILAKLHSLLNPALNEMFFCKVLVLTEGIEDIAYISSYLELLGITNSFREHGCHLVSTNGKSGIAKPLAIAKSMEIPVFLVFDADTDKTKTAERDKHRADNRAILNLLGYESLSEWPSGTLWKADCVMWSTNLSDAIHSELGDSWTASWEAARSRYGHAPNLNKNPLAISYALEHAWVSDLRSQNLERLARQITLFASGA